MNLRLIPFQVVGLASVSLVEAGDSCPSYARVVDLGVGRAVRRIALASTIWPTDDTSSWFAATTGSASPEAKPIDPARLDALIDMVERGGVGSHECGGA